MTTKKPDKPYQLDLGQVYETDEALGEGKWHEVEISKDGRPLVRLPVRLARAESTEWRRVAASMWKRYAKSKAWRDLSPDKQASIEIATLARATWKGFDASKARIANGHGDWSEPQEIEVIVAGEVMQDTVADREKMLREFPLFRAGIIAAAQLEADAFDDALTVVGEA